MPKFTIAFMYVNTHYADIDAPTLEEAEKRARKATKQLDPEIFDQMEENDFAQELLRIRVTPFEEDPDPNGWIDVIDPEYWFE